MLRDCGIWRIMALKDAPWLKYIDYCGINSREDA